MKNIFFKISVVLLIVLVVMNNWLFEIVFKNNNSLYSVGDYVQNLFNILSIGILAVTLFFQTESFSITNFETHFYTLINIHRQNISEIKIKDISDRACFLKMFRELREITLELRSWLTLNNLILSEELIVKISFNIFYYGVGSNSIIVLKDKPIFREVAYGNRILEYFRLKEVQKKLKKKLKADYRICGGHLSRLDHYFRHLFVIISVVNDRKLKQNDKKKYIDILKSQLSVHEQLMLKYFAYSQIDEKQSKLINKYKLFEDIPAKFNEI